MIVLVSGSTKTVRQIHDQHRNHLGILLTPKNRNSIKAVLKLGLPWAVDNGAFAGFDEIAFRRLLGKVAGKPGLLWVVAPDVVGNARLTLFKFDQWRQELMNASVPIAFVAQDGLEDLYMPVENFDCLFIGGSTKFKLSQAAGDLAAEAKRHGKLVHMGRVNSRKRMETAMSMGADSVDGSSLSMFGDKYIHTFCRWARELEIDQAMQPRTLLGGAHVLA